VVERYHVIVKGTRPLLMHAPTGLGDKPQRRRGEHLEPEVEARSYLYRDDEGRIVIPAVNIKACIRDAGANYRVSGRRCTFKAMIKAALDIEPFPYVPLLVPDGEKPGNWRLATDNDYVVDIRPVVVQGSRILRARPRFDKWALEFSIINKDPTVVHAETLKKILVDAGKWYGLGDFRPEFGLFEVVKFVKQETT